MALSKAAVALPVAGIEVRELTTLEQFDALRDEWNALVDRLPVPAPFQTWEWNRIWWNHFGHGRSLLILAFYRGPRLAGLAPFFRRRIGSVGLSMLQPLGWEGNGRGNGLTEQWELLFPAEDRAELLDQLSGWLHANPWSVVLLPGFDDSQPLPAWMSARVAYRGKGVLFDYRSVPQTWEQLVAGLNKSMRDNVRYYPRLIVRHGHTYEFEVASTPSELSAALPVLFNLHRERAEASMKIAHDNYFDHPNRRAFIREVAPMLAEQGEAKVGVIRIDGEPVATQMWFERGETMFLYYSGFLPKWKHYSVALLATIGAFQNAIGRGVRRIEFLAGGGHPKERWDTEQRVHSNLWLVRHPRMTRFLFSLPIRYKQLA